MSEQTTPLSDQSDEASEEELDAVFDRCGRCNGIVAYDGLCDACFDDLSEELEDMSDE